VISQRGAKSGLYGNGEASRHGLCRRHGCEWIGRHGCAGDTVVQTTRLCRRHGCADDTVVSGWNGVVWYGIDGMDGYGYGDGRDGIVWGWQ
jgi:hypothetical protein